MKSLLRVLFLVLWTLVGIPAAWATTFVRVGDGVMADQAAVIVEVQVLEVDASPGLERPVTDYLVEVEHQIKGFPGDWLVVRVAGGLLEDGRGLHLFGAPRFAVGDRALLFLNARGDGTWRIHHFLLGAFYLAELETSGRAPKSLAFRDFSEAHELKTAGLGGARHPEAPRDLVRFRQWLEDHLAGVERPHDYFVDPASFEPPARPGSADKFTILQTGNNEGIRWTEFDRGASVTWRAHQDLQPGLDENTFNTVRSAINAWTNDPSTPIRYVWGGGTTATGGFSTFDGINAFLFEDPSGEEFDEPYSCTQGGVIAVGGPWFRTQQHTFRGMTFRSTSGADVITNRGLRCAMERPGFGAAVFAHELGHTLGLGHSCDDMASGPCNTPAKAQALMRANLVGPPYQGAVLRSDDREGAAFLYQQAQTAPTAPGNLNAVALEPDRVRLTWQDRSDNEDTFEIERRDDSQPGAQFAEIASVGDNTTQYEDDTVSSGLAYTYRVRARNGSGASGFSNQASVSTPGERAPTALAASPLSASEVRLTWVDNALSEFGYAVQVAVGNAAAGDELTFTLVSTLPADSVETTVSGLEAGTIYTFRVRAVGGVGDSSYAVAVASTSCAAGDDRLCLNGNRFQVEVEWRDFAGNTGGGRVVPFGADDSGLLWFFEADNWEMLVKVLNGCGFNERFWVFAAATTDVEYTLKVTDTATATIKTYTNELGNASAAITDTGAFATCSASAALAPPARATARAAQDFLAALKDRARSVPVGVNPQGVDGTSCTASDTRLCLNGGRFQVEVDWQDFAGNTGAGRVVPFGSDDSGLLWFFAADNWEMLIKVLTGCELNNHYWVFAAATTNVRYTLTVTDTSTGATKQYTNPLGLSAPALTDTAAFPSCP